MRCTAQQLVDSSFQGQRLPYCQHSCHEWHLFSTSALIARILLLLLLLFPAAQGHRKLCFLGAASASD
jgi:hypothetical protein